MTPFTLTLDIVKEAIRDERSEALLPVMRQIAAGWGNELMKISETKTFALAAHIDAYTMAGMGMNEFIDLLVEKTKLLLPIVHLFTDCEYRANHNGKGDICVVRIA